MGIQIDSGTGAGFSAGVSSRKRLLTESMAANHESVIALDDERAFNAVFNDASAAAGNYVAYIKNTSATRNMFIHLVRVQAANAARWRIFKVTGTGSGTTVTATNLKLSSSVTPEATILADNITGLSTDGEIAPIRTAASASFDAPFDGSLILGPQNAIAVEYDTGTTGAAECLIRFFYEDI